MLRCTMDLEGEMNFFDVSFHFPSDALTPQSPLTPLHFDDDAPTRTSPPFEIATVSPLDTHKPPVMVMVEASPCPLDTHALPSLGTIEESPGPLETPELWMMTHTLRPQSPAIALWPCVPCGRELPVGSFCPSSIRRRLKRCRKCCSALVRTSATKQHTRNPKGRLVGAVQRRTRALHGGSVPAWVATAGVVQALLNFAGWCSVLSASTRNLTLVQRRGSSGAWAPHESVCVTLDEALVYSELPWLHTEEGHSTQAGY